MTQDIAQAIAEHHRKLIDGLQRSLDKYRSIKSSDRPDVLVSQMAYWTNAISALKWSTSVAQQEANSDNARLS